MASLRSRHTPLSGDERAYVVSRLVLNLLYLVTLLIGLPVWVPPAHRALFVTAAILFTAGSFAMVFFVHARRARLPKVMMGLLPLDAVAFAISVYAGSAQGDTVYPVFVAAAVLYALIEPRREGLIAGAVLGGAFIMGHLAPQHWVGYAPLTHALQFGTIMLVAGVVSLSVSRRNARELEAEVAVGEREAMNEQLTRRLIELQAVAEITDVIHASLDADVVGPRVVEILSKVIGVEACTLLVIDKNSGETVFEAGHGGVGPVAAFSLPGEGSTRLNHYLPDASDSPFSCLAVHEHDTATVVFCADAHDMEMLTAEDRLVLSAVAAELVVAIENSQLYQLTRKLAITDELTGLYNRRFLSERLEEESVRARRYGGTLSLLMLDCDDFKDYNDTYGHLAGDLALAELATVLREAVREVDVVARYGGEEFCILLPATDESGAFVVAEKVREAVATHGFGPDNRTLTVSVGVATMPQHASDEEGLQRAADDALYDAKNGGKNRIRVPRRMSDEKLDPKTPVPGETR